MNTWGTAISCAVEPGRVALAGSERLSTGAVAYARSGGRASLRPVFCPSCGTHYTTVVPPEHRVATVVHVVCAGCGGDGRPASLDVPR